MKRALIASSQDVKNLAERFASRFGAADDAVCTSNKDLENLSPVDEIYFVFSQNAVLSTQYQALVLDILSGMKRAVGARCFLLRLDTTEIPQGFDVLKSLPEKTIL